MKYEEIAGLLRDDNPENEKSLIARAYEAKILNRGKKVFFRGLIEFSNICAKDCFYCGIRKSNVQNNRYQMERQEIIDAAMWAYKNRFGSIVLQSGERESRMYTEFVESIVSELKTRTSGKLGITLCLGERTEKVYRRWFQAGAHRYLLRIESSNPELYAKLHPESHSYQKRLDCLNSLKAIGYQLGTGVMIGLPEQTVDDLAHDVLFFKNIGADMIGMGPYIPHAQTPLTGAIADEQSRFRLAIRMIAVTRLAIPDINIAATTALQVLDPSGREKGLLAGANVIMPNITPVKYRHDYQLYEGKPCLDDDGEECLTCLSGRIGMIGEEIGWNEWGDSPHYFKRQPV